MKVAVTGAGGFLGRALTRSLAGLGYGVTAMDVAVSPPGTQPSGVETLCVDVSNAEALKRIDWSAFDAVVHLAAAGVKVSNRTWNACARVNVGGAVALLDALGRLARPPVLLCFRTFYENWLGRNLPGIDGNPYVLTKRVATALNLEWARAPGEQRRLMLATVYQVYGADDSPDNVLTYALRRFEAGERAVFGLGAGLRDWIHIDDAVAAIEVALRTGLSEKGVVEFDIGTGILTSLREMVLALAAIMGVPPERVVFGEREDRGDLTIVEAACNLLPGWTPSLTVEEGLRRMAGKELLK